MYKEHYCFYVSEDHVRAHYVVGPQENRPAKGVIVWHVEYPSCNILVILTTQ
jgi:hypothetical protein